MYTVIVTDNVICLPIIGYIVMDQLGSRSTAVDVVAWLYSKDEN